MNSIIGNSLTEGLFILRERAPHGVLGDMSSRHLRMISVPLITKIGENNVAIESLSRGFKV